MCAIIYNVAAVQQRECWCGSMAEQLICNQQVDGSTPFTSSIYGGFPERPKGADCKSVVTDFGGPNPPSPTKKHFGRGAFFILKIERERKIMYYEMYKDARNGAWRCLC